MFHSISAEVRLLFCELSLRRFLLSMFGVPGEFAVVIDATNGIGRIVKLAFLFPFGT